MAARGHPRPASGRRPRLRHRRRLHPGRITGGVVRPGERYQEPQVKEKTMAAEHFVRYETNGRVAVITLDRPKAANAQTPGILKDLDDAWRRADEDPEVRVIVLP